jgi:ABC-type antimicrobial peptide transport system permease subunit
VYTPFAQTPFLWLYFMVRTAGDPASVAGSVRSLVKSVDPALTAAALRPMDIVVANTVAQPRLNVMLLGALALVALALASIGIYGVIAYSVAQRRREIGVRIALGATKGDLGRLVIGEGLRLCAIGVVLGTAGAFAVTRMMERLVYGISTTDPTTFVVVPLVLTGVALAACALPARRAARVDPMTALRAE